jgi:hypothetical protein
MAKQYFVRLLIRNQRDDLVFEVREAESDHLAVRLAEHSELDEPDFCWFQSVEGKSVIVNLADIQAARFFWEAADGPSDLVRHEGPIEIQLRGRKKPLEEFAEDAGQIHDLFASLDLGASEPAFHCILDADGDPLVLNAREVVWIIAPQPVLD